MSDITETAINWNHDTGEIWISTRKRSIASKLLNLGAERVSEGGHGYINLKASESDLKVSFRKPKNLSPEQRKAAGRRLAAARKKG